MFKLKITSGSFIADVPRARFFEHIQKEIFSNIKINQKSVYTITVLFYHIYRYRLLKVLDLSDLLFICSSSVINPRERKCHFLPSAPLKVMPAIFETILLWKDWQIKYLGLYLVISNVTKHLTRNMHFERIYRLDVFPFLKYETYWFYSNW